VGRLDGSDGGLVEEEGDPFLGGGAIIRASADEFDFARQLLDEARLAELSQRFDFVSLQPFQ